MKSSKIGSKPNRGKNIGKKSLKKWVLTNQQNKNRSNDFIWNTWLFSLDNHKFERISRFRDSRSSFLPGLLPVLLFLVRLTYRKTQWVSLSLRYNDISKNGREQKFHWVEPILPSKPSQEKLFEEQDLLLIFYKLNLHIINLMKFIMSNFFLFWLDGLEKWNKLFCMLNKTYNHI